MNRLQRPPRFRPAPARPRAAAHDGAVPITFVSSHALHGGAELNLQRVIERLGPGWVRGIVVLADGPLVELLRRLGHPLAVIPTPARLGMLVAAWRLRRSLLHERPALVHADGIKAALVSVIATVGTGIPVVWLKVDYSRDGWLAYAIAARCRRVIGISRAVTEIFRGPLRARVRVVPCGIPDHAVDRAAARTLVVELAAGVAEAPVIAHLGRLHPRKGQLELVEVVPEVLGVRPGTRILFLPAPAETDEEREHERRVRARIDELGVADSVTLAPRRGGSIEVMAGSDVVVVTSLPDPVSGWREGFGMVGAEAMAVGTPVVGYADGALPEVLGDCALLVPPGDRRALAGALVRVLGDPALAERLVGCGAKRVERYRLGATIERLKSCYSEAVAG